MKKLEERIEQARELHKDGYNCSQCVVMVFDDIHNLSHDVSACIAAGLGGGVGGQRQICGAVNGMAILEGFMFAPGAATKPLVYKKVKENSDEFKELNGSIVCGELLGLGKSDAGCETVNFRRKPCMEYIEDAIGIIHNKLAQ